MATTRTITVHDHEVFVRVVEVPDEISSVPAVPFTAITGGSRTMAYTAALGVLTLAVALMPTIVGLFH